MKQKNIIIFDLEATCEKDNREYPKETIEIGAIDIKGREFSQFIKPIQKPILTDFCKELTTISQTDINTAQSFKLVYPKFYNFFKDSILMSWSSYDKRQLIKDLKLNHMTLGIDYLNKNHFDLREYFHKVTGKKKVRSMKHAAAILHISLDGTHHRGIDDARNLLKIYNKLQELEKTKN